MLQVCTISGQPETVWDDESFAQLLEEHLGLDAACYFRDVLREKEDSIRFDTNLCAGECDRTYQIEEYYREEISDVLDVLSTINGKTKADKDKISHVLRTLEGALRN